MNHQTKTLIRSGPVNGGRSRVVTLLESGVLRFENGTIESDVSVLDSILADLDLNRNVQVEEPYHEVLSYTSEDYASEPVITARRIRLIALKDEAQRERMLAQLSDAERAYIEQTGLSWDELAYVPDAVFLAKHLGALPETMQSKIADGYIRDGSEKCFNGMTFGELKDIPVSLLLLYSLPMLEKEARDALAQSKRMKQYLRILKTTPDKVHGGLPAVIRKVYDGMDPDERRDLVNSAPGIQKYLDK